MPILRGGGRDLQNLRGRLLSYQMVGMRSGPLEVEFELFSPAIGSFMCTIAHNRFPQPPQPGHFYIAVGYMNYAREFEPKTMHCTHLIPAWNQEYE